MIRYTKIIFLDEENTTLSVLAQALLQKKFMETNVFGVKVESRGNVVLFPEPANQKVEEIASRHDMDIKDYVARQMESSDFEEGTLVLALDTQSRIKAYSKYVNASGIYTLREFIGQQGDIRFQPGKNIEDYIDTYALLERSIEMLINKLKEEK